VGYPVTPTDNAADMPTVAAYTRVSTREQAEGSGLGTQRQKIRQWARLHDVENVELYEDAGASGGTTDREALHQLLEDVENGDIETVVVYKADRLSRSLRDLLTLLDNRLEPNGVRFVSVTEQFDTSTASGRLFLQMLGSFSEFERNVITERTTEGRRRKAEGGGHACGSVPFGYRKTDGGELEPDPDTAPIVRRIFRMRRRREMSLRAIAEELNAEGVPTQRGGDWHASTVRYILQNPKYDGRMQHTFDGETVEVDVDGLQVA
jgi:DNA invertase Pin-like site-specific DNA recombinase